MGTSEDAPFRGTYSAPRWILYLEGCIARRDGYYYCNDLFSRFEQQTSILEKLAEATDPTTDRQGHDGPSQGIVSKHLENLKLGTENRLSELRNGVAGWTVTGVTDRHRPFTQNQVSELCDGQQDGPSQARRPVTVA